MNLPPEIWDEIYKIRKNNFKKRIENFPKHNIKWKNEIRQYLEVSPLRSYKYKTVGIIKMPSGQYETKSFIISICYYEDSKKLIHEYFIRGKIPGAHYTKTGEVYIYS